MRGVPVAEGQIDQTVSWPLLLRPIMYILFLARLVPEKDHILGRLRASVQLFVLKQ